jgi:hypothetical protein
MVRVDDYEGYDHCLMDEKQLVLSWFSLRLNLGLNPAYPGIFTW